jgi:hypothetical protein
MGNPALNASRQGREWPQGYRPLNGAFRSIPGQGTMAFIPNGGSDVLRD